MQKLNKKENQRVKELIRESLIQCFGENRFSEKNYEKIEKYLLKAAL